MFPPPRSLQQWKKRRQPPGGNKGLPVPLHTLSQSKRTGEGGERWGEREEEREARGEGGGEGGKRRGRRRGRLETERSKRQMERESGDGLARTVVERRYGGAQKDAQLSSRNLGKTKRNGKTRAIIWSGASQEGGGGSRQTDKENERGKEGSGRSQL